LKTIRNWKKVFESDLDYIVAELKEAVTAPAVLILSGPVGAGKTTFTKRFVKGIAKETPAPARAHEFEVVSPTYGLIHESGNLAHADFYRIKDREEILHLEIELYLENKDYFLVEWGMPFLPTLRKEVGEHFKFYQVEIIINDSNSEKATGPSESSRDFFLQEL